jgi:indole-3-glycerol phosphate synthase
MSETFLDTILATKRARLERQKRETALKARSLEVRQNAKKHRLQTRLARSDRINIIAEIKRASPSKGIINDAINVTEVAKSYRDGRAAAISVLTEEDFFHGSLADLIAVKGAVDLPILRKDFIVDEFQIYESAAAGADVILLIVAALPKESIKTFLRMAHDDLGMDVIVEIHDANELAIATSIGAMIIGVNNRNLHSFDVSIDVSRRLIEQRPVDALMISESGISTREEIDELKALGYNGFLIGETLMTAGDSEMAILRLTGANDEG